MTERQQGFDGRESTVPAGGGESVERVGEFLQVRESDCVKRLSFDRAKPWSAPSPPELSRGWHRRPRRRVIDSTAALFSITATQRNSSDPSRVHLAASYGDFSITHNGERGANHPTDFLSTSE